MKDMICNDGDLRMQLMASSNADVTIEPRVSPAGYKMIIVPDTQGLNFTIHALDFAISVGPVRVDYPFLWLSFVLRAQEADDEMAERIETALAGGVPA